jgi:hypothetical protein
VHCAQLEGEANSSWMLTGLVVRNIMASQNHLVSLVILFTQAVLPMEWWSLNGQYRMILSLQLAGIMTGL